MNIEIDNTAQRDAPHHPQKVSDQAVLQTIQRTRLFSILGELATVLGLALIAFIPRMLLAMQLDMVTDEGVYILGGKIYLPLLTHLNIRSSDWTYNYEHPPFVKLLIGLALSLNTWFGHPLSELVAARIPSIIMGTLLIVALYWLGRAPFGHVVALVAALSLAASPWLVYFSALAYLDMTMTALITVASLLIWHAIRRPWLYPLSALLFSLGADSKYTAVLAIPGLILFTAYYFLLIRPHIPVEQRPGIPWPWWIAAIIVAPVAFLIADPAIWTHPISLLLHSFRFEWDHSRNGHLTFIAGHYAMHVPRWAILYILLAKISAFVTIPAAFFSVFALVQLVRFHRGYVTAIEATNISFLFIWLVSILGMFSLLNIVVGTHYHLPMATPVVLAGAFGLAVLLRYQRSSLFALHKTRVAKTNALTSPTGDKIKINLRASIVVALLALLLAGPHLIGLTTVYAAEGYTSEFFPGENAVLQVAYPGYREAVQWIAADTHGPVRVGLVAVPGTISGGGNSVSWYSYNKDLPGRLTLTEVPLGETRYQYDYLVWPMHLVQRGYTISEPWRSHVVHVVMGGNTVYCYVMGRT